MGDRAPSPSSTLCKCNFSQVLNVKLIELIGRQKELQEATGVTLPPDRDRLLAAIIAECGELAQALKSEWRWWGHEGKEVRECDRDEMLAECADILHFTLAFLIDAEMTPQYSCSWEYGWSQAKALQPWAYLINFQSFLATEAPNLAVTHLAQAFAGLGFTQEEIEAAYLAKADFNQERMEAVHG